MPPTNINEEAVEDPPHRTYFKHASPAPTTAAAALTGARRYAKGTADDAVCIDDDSDDYADVKPVELLHTPTKRRDSEETTKPRRWDVERERVKRMIHDLKRTFHNGRYLIMRHLPSNITEAVSATVC